MTIGSCADKCNEWKIQFEFGRVHVLLLKAISYNDELEHNKITGFSDKRVNLKYDIDDELQGRAKLFNEHGERMKFQFYFPFLLFHTASPLLNHHHSCCYDTT